MKITSVRPRENTERIRKVYALLPKWFNHGSLNEPLRTMVWFDYYYVTEYYRYGGWNRAGSTHEQPKEYNGKI